MIFEEVCAIRCSGGTKFVTSRIAARPTDGSINCPDRRHNVETTNASSGRLEPVSVLDNKAEIAAGLVGGGLP